MPSRLRKSRSCLMRPTLLISLLLGLVLAGCIGWAEYTSWREVFELQQRLEAPDLQRLLHESGHWPEADRDIFQGIVTEARQSLDSFRIGLIASYAAMFLLAAVIVRTVRREMIDPLASKLVESNELIARQEKLASLGLLGAGVAHEIRNPLVAIKARLFSQKKKLSRGSAEFNDAEFINDEINRLEQIVRNFLQFARPPEPCLQPVETAAFLAPIVELMEPDVERRRIKLRLEAPPNVRALMDAAQMKQVLINLIRNAAESIGADGTITVRARETTLPFASQQTSAVALEVEDDGPGIPADIRPKIFDPFFTTKAAGVGLGLPIAERIAEKHGGSLQYRSTPNGRTVFSVTLPAAAEAAPGG
ncbi:MAG: hypothetical protein EOP84_19935 [Verrucomicrobiaceae bacterium]|nr:MAG: hypothetical protein EOP84_19935 [Verrucomicrobiaceae bacterium]